MKYIALLIFGVMSSFSISLAEDSIPKKQPYDMNVAFPVDDQKWIPVNPSLPFNPDNEIWLIPKGKMLKDHELISVKRYPLGSRMDKISNIPKEPNASKIYESLDKTSRTSALEHYSENFGRSIFKIDHFFEDAEAVYQIHVHLPSSQVDEKARLKWIDRIKSTSNSSKNPLWIHITPKGIFQNGEEINPSTRFAILLDKNTNIRLPSLIHGYG